MNPLAVLNETLKVTPSSKISGAYGPRVMFRPPGTPGPGPGPVKARPFARKAEGLVKDTMAGANKRVGGNCILNLSAMTRKEHSDRQHCSLFQPPEQHVNEPASCRA